MDVNECSYDQSYDGRKTGLPERVEVRARLERRRRWSSTAKLAIIRETLMAGTTAQAVADRHEICHGLIYTWRKQMLRQPKRSRLWLNDGSCVRLRPERPNQVWAYDFVEDRTRDSRKFRMLNVVDEFTRECLCIRVGRKLKAADVIDVLADHSFSVAHPGTSTRTMGRSLPPRP